MRPLSRAASRDSCSKCTICNFMQQIHLDMIYIIPLGSKFCYTIHKIVKELAIQIETDG